MYCSDHREVPPTRKPSHFVKGPLQLDWFERTAKCGPSAVTLGLLLHYKRGFGDRELCVSTELAKRFGVSESTRRRTLRKMAAAGLIEMKITGRKRRVVLLP